VALLYNSPADVIRWLLVQLGTKSMILPSGQVIPIGLVTDPTLDQPWPCYASDEPDIPDNCVTVYDTQGRDDGRSMIDGERYEHHGIQIRVRAQSHIFGYLQSRQIAVALDQFVVGAGVTVSGHSFFVPCVSRTSGVIPLGRDTPNTKRRIFTINAVCPIGELV
jgi:hypothetical protein